MGNGISRVTGCTGHEDDSDTTKVQPEFVEADVENAKRLEEEAALEKEYRETIRKNMVNRDEKENQVKTLTALLEAMMMELKESEAQLSTVLEDYQNHFGKPLEDALENE